MGGTKPNGMDFGPGGGLYPWAQSSKELSLEIVLSLGSLTLINKINKIALRLFY